MELKTKEWQLNGLDDNIKWRLYNAEQFASSLNV